jgi:hypothetical protein
VSWTQQQAIDLCRQIEIIAPDHGCHVALTGGLLYKFGDSSTGIRQRDKIAIDGLFSALTALGIVRVTTAERFVIKAKHAHGVIDCLFPEFDGAAVYVSRGTGRGAAE